MFGLPENTSSIDIKSLRTTYRALTKQYHPDTFVGSPTEDVAWAEEQFKILNDAYETLTDETKLRNYINAQRSQETQNSPNYSQSQHGEPNSSSRNTQ